jgi:AAA15 family ATPase/GTPase
LQYFDTGIQSIEAEEISLDKLLQEMPDTTRQNLIQDLNAQIGKTPKMYSDGTNFFTLRRDSEGNIVASKMLLDHGNADELFESREESDGTRRLFDLIPLLLQRESRVIVIDEIDRSLHSKLVEEFIAKFYENTKGSAIQLIASTHDSNVLDLQKLRQDEIWFIERQQDCSSRLFSLSEFKERFDRNIEKDYLLGRYGAIPLFKTWEAESSGE